MIRLRWLIIGGIVTSGICALATMHWVWNALPAPRGIEPSHTERTAAVRAQPANLIARVDRVGPTVVTTRTKPLDLPDIAERHFDIYLRLKESWNPSGKPIVGIGSGFILDQDGYAEKCSCLGRREQIYVRLTEVRLEQCPTHPSGMIASWPIPARTPGAGWRRALSWSQ